MDLPQYNRVREKEQEVIDVAKVDDALERIEKQRGSDAGINEVLDFLTAWVTAEGETSAALILDKGKTAKGAFDALKTYAQKNQKGGYYRYEEKLAFAKIMAYYGVPEKEADTRLEHGLFYRVMAAKMEKWRPYGEAPQGSSAVSASDTPISAASAPAVLSLSLSDLGL